MFQQTITKLISLILLSLFAASVMAKDAGVLTQGEHARVTPPGARNGAVFVTLTNLGDTEISAVDASGEIAKRVELHEHKHENGMMKMRQVEAIVLPPGQPVLLQKGGLHVMLIGLKKPLVAGETFTIELLLSNGKRQELTVPVIGKDASVPK